MAQGFWDKIASYLNEVEIESAESKFSGKLTIGFRRGRYVLSSPNAVYSHEDLYYNFKNVFAKIDLGFKNVLVLGGGLASVPLILEKTYAQNSSYTLVEIDPVVVGFCQKYALPNLNSPCELICASADDYVRECGQKFDCVIVDIFIDADTPSQFERVEFLEMAKNCLAENGILLYNRLAPTPEKEQADSVYFQQVFQQIFPQASMFKILNNKILSSKFYPFEV